MSSYDRVHTIVQTSSPEVHLADAQLHMHKKETGRSQDQVSFRTKLSGRSQDQLPTFINPFSAYIFAMQWQNQISLDGHWPVWL